MNFDIESIAQRFVICRASAICKAVKEHDIGAIVTATNPNIRGLSDFNFDRLPNMTTALHKLLPRASATENTDSVISDLNMAEQLFHDIGDQKLLVHCSAGISNSPMFTLMLMLHISGDTGDKNLDEALKQIHALTPEASLTQDVHRYRDYLSSRFTNYQRAIFDYSVAKSLSKNDDEARYRRQLTQVFRGNSQPTDREVLKMYDRFGIKPVPFQNNL